MESVVFDGNTYVRNIAYNAKGQAILSAFGNGTMTRAAYDPLTSRLLRTRTERYKLSVGQPFTYQSNSGAKQDLAYAYDPYPARIIHRKEGSNTQFRGATKKLPSLPSHLRVAKGGVGGGHSNAC
ncbi:MAG: hypothetical protein SFW35_03425 [Chitinophagales bacterium]|nr:hypothetical protein [Chitinophagales bacterium]